MAKRDREAKEYYLRIIYELEEHEKAGVKSIEIARKLEISKPSVSEMLRKLQAEKLIKKEKYGKIFLTKKGRLKADKLFDSHYTIKRFLKHVIKHNDDKAREEAHKISHILSEETIERIEKLMEGKALEEDETEKLLRPLPPYIG